MEPALVSDPHESGDALIDHSLDHHGEAYGHEDSGHHEPHSYPLQDPFTVDSSLIQGAGVITGSDDISGVNDGDLDLSQTFFLNSNPDARHTIYLDFDGHITTNTIWNTENNLPQIVTPKFNVGNGDPDVFTDSELTMIQKIWAGVAEDFAPFKINVTTEDPGSGALRKSGSSDPRWGIRVVMGKTQGLGNIGGVAYIGSFNWSSDTPAFALNVYGADRTASHEVGHALGLGHDGTAQSSYYGGHGSGATGWVPIMGSGAKNLSQWSRGEYAGASNRQNDLQVISRSRNGFGYRIDDHGSVLSHESATKLVPDSANQISGQGIIERNTDDDVFTFTTGGGDVVIDVTPARYSPNLDILAEIYDSDGALVASSNPFNALDAGFNLNLNAGHYFLKITGTGKGDVLGNGYSDYGSLGNYWVSGSISNPTLQIPGDIDGDGFVGTADIDFLINLWNTPVANDPSGDGFIGIDDLNLVLSNWDDSAQPGDADLTTPSATSGDQPGTGTALDDPQGVSLLSPDTQLAVAAWSLQQGGTTSVAVSHDYHAWSLDSDSPESLLGLWEQVRSV